MSKCKEREKQKMIDINKAKEKFIQYIEHYDLENRHLNRKQFHSYRVMAISKQIAQQLYLNEEQVKIATLIGLLHDIARFEQFTKYGTFRDRESFDHGDLGVEILRQDNYIKEYTDNEEDIKTICAAIKNHNKYKIEKGVNPLQETFCKIIRDADKIDIFYEATGIFYTKQELEEINQSVISKEIVSKIYEKKTINRNEIKEKGPLIKVLVLLAFIFDIQYKISYKIICNEDYINKIFERFHFKDQHTKDEMQKIQAFLNQYIKEKIQNI